VIRGKRPNVKNKKKRKTGNVKTKLKEGKAS